MQNRQKDEIVRDILSVCNGGCIISKIMFHAYLSHAQVKGYLGELIESNLIDYDTIDKKYQTTTKGLECLSGLETMSEILTLPTKRISKPVENTSPSY